jgi:ferredoxin
MLHTLSTTRATREVWWVHGARNHDEHAFAGEADALLATLPHGHRLVFYSSPSATDRRGHDYDETGHVTADAILAAGAPVTSDFYLCGPAGFMTSLQAGLGALGVSPADVHVEHFGAEGAITPGVVAGPERRPHAPEGPAGTGAPVSFARSGLQVPWDDRFASILDFAEACDVPVRWSCRTGVCHTCETGLLDGHVVYGPDPLEAPATGSVLLCCSRPAGDLTLDL